MGQMEWLPQVNPDGEVIGRITRAEAHQGSFKLHPVVHLHLFNSMGELYLQKRAMNKDIQPGKWDTAVGGHVDFDEEIEQALLRETKEELGIQIQDYRFIERYSFTSQVESELVYLFTAIFDGVVLPNPEEIEQGRFWPLAEIDAHLHSGIFTSNFRQEYLSFEHLFKTMFT